MTKKVVDVLDAARMTAPSSGETAYRVSKYFGEAGPFSYQKVRKLTPALLEGRLSYEVATAGIDLIKFDLAKNCNRDVAKLVAECDEFRGRQFYPLKRILYPIDRTFSVSVRPETVAVVDGIPNLIFLQPRKTATPWAYNAAFMRKLVEETYVPDYYEKARFWLVDTEAKDGNKRQLDLVDLTSIAIMSDREFIRRIASLRNAWRLHLTDQTPKKRREKTTDDNQVELDWGDE